MAEFGIADGIDEWIGAGSFNPRDVSQTYTYQLHSYYASTTGGQWEAGIPLHNGNLLVGYRVYYTDNSAAANITVRVHQYDYNFTTGASVTSIPFTFTSTGQPGTTDTFVTTNLTVDLRDGVTDRFYAMAIVLPADTTVQFKGVRLFWRRQVAPAPGVASFSDVPTNHVFFQFIEALVDSGITTGCAPGQYCPDAPITRGQMAVFMARALGLHWPF